MRTIAYYFSGTGNTKRVMEGLAEQLRLLGEEVSLFPISASCPPPPPHGYERVIIGYPVHAFNAPLPVLQFLKRLPRAPRFLPVYLVRTSGEPLKLNHASGVVPKRILGEKGYFLKGEFHYVMPYNIIFRHSDGMAARMKRAAELCLPRDARTIAAGQGTLSRVGLFRRMASFVLRIEHPAMPLLGRTFKATDKCVGCGLCAKVCPQGNITMEEGKPKFGHSCAACMGCAFHCPKDAIRISLLNGWRVNGEYSFEGAPAADSEVCKYCHNAYVRYFHAAEEK